MQPVDLKAILAAGDTFGRSDAGNGARVQVEFVSAYPTGPLTVLHGRGAAVGDALANLFEWTGCEVERECYLNDAGEQIERLARSVAACYLQLAGRPGGHPDDGYHAEVVEPLALAVREREGDCLLGLAPAERQRELVQFLHEEIGTPAARDVDASESG